MQPIRPESALSRAARRRTRRHLFSPLLIAIAAMFAQFASHCALAQGSRTIRLVIPYPPGGGVDVMSRLLAEQVGRMQGPKVVIDNRPGGGSVIGMESVARAVPDGNTVLMVTSTFIVTPHVHKLNFDPMTSFEPICAFASTPPTFAVNGDSSYRTLDDLLNAARADPAKLTVATTPGTFLHVTFEMLQRLASFKMTFVPYAGTAPAVTALLGGHVTAAFVDYPSIAEQLDGKLRALATTARSRLETLPGVPTIGEFIPGYEAALWYGLLAPAKTPKDTIGQLAGWFTAALHAPEMKTKFLAQGLFAFEVCGAEFAALVRKQYDEYGRAIADASIKTE